MERECTSQTSGDEERLTITTVILREPQTPFAKYRARRDHDGVLRQRF